MLRIIPGPYSTVCNTYLQVLTVQDIATVIWKQNGQGHCNVLEQNGQGTAEYWKQNGQGTAGSVLEAEWPR